MRTLKKAISKRKFFTQRQDMTLLREGVQERNWMHHQTFIHDMQ